MALNISVKSQKQIVHLNFETPHRSNCMKPAEKIQAWIKTQGSEKPDYQKEAK